MLVTARHYATGELVEVRCTGDRISSIALASSASTGASIPWVAPAFFDLQINGCDGHSFNSERLTIDSVRHIVNVCHRHGIAGLCSTLITNSFEALAHGMTTIRHACDADQVINRAVQGIHLEGPSVSLEDGPRGAHPKKHVRPPDWHEFQRLQEASCGRIRLVTLAPEHEGALRYIEQLTKAGVVVALGHTAATGERIRDAIGAGARLSTHLGNGTSALLPRHENVIWEQLAADELWTSIICDGQHLPPALIRCILRVKTPSRTILTCDAGSLAGMPPGRYQEWGQDLDVLPEGKIVVTGTPYLAGSWVFTEACVAHVIAAAGIGLKNAVDMASARPRELLGLPPQPMEAGALADLVLFDWKHGEPLRLLKTIVAGAEIH